ncbi:translationally-controlled tumor protein [Streptomyces exfoliatus]|uniref:translationally-controlled tumor protein n=1 Tax=Streptomyces exfoliatus TaxID=1905 RepID=UPI003C30D416
MKLYKDVVSHDDLLSDDFPIKEDGAVYVVEGKYVTTGAVTVDIGSDAGEVEDDDEPAPDPVTQLNVVTQFSLVETSFDKKSYTAHLKAYLTKVVAERLPADERAAWQEQAAEWGKKVMSDFGSYRFFTGPTMASDALVILVKTGEDGKTPFLYYIRHGLTAEVL